MHGGNVHHGAYPANRLRRCRLRCPLPPDTGHRVSAQRCPSSSSETMLAYATSLPMTTRRVARRTAASSRRDGSYTADGRQLVTPDSARSSRTHLGRAPELSARADDSGVPHVRSVAAVRPDRGVQRVSAENPKVCCSPWGIANSLRIAPCFFPCNLRYCWRWAFGLRGRVRRARHVFRLEHRVGRSRRPRWSRRRGWLWGRGCSRCGRGSRWCREFGVRWCLEGLYRELHVRRWHGRAHADYRLDHGRCVGSRPVRRPTAAASSNGSRRWLSAGG